MHLKVEHVSEGLGVLAKYRFLGPTHSGSDLVGLMQDQESAFIRSSQIILKMPDCGPHLEKFYLHLLYFTQSASS